MHRLDFKRMIVASAAVFLLTVYCFAGCGRAEPEIVTAPELFKSAMENCSSANFTAEVVLDDRVVTVLEGAFDSSMNFRINTDAPVPGSSESSIILYFAQGEKAFYYVNGKTIFKMQPDDVYDRIMAIPVIGKKYAFLDPDKIPVISGKKPKKFLMAVLDIEYSPDTTADATELMLHLNDTAASKLVDFIMNMVKLAAPTRGLSSAELDRFRQYVMKALREMKVYVTVDEDKMIFRSISIDLTDSMPDISVPAGEYWPDISVPQSACVRIVLSDVNGVDTIKVPDEFQKAAENLLTHITQTLY